MGERRNLYQTMVGEFFDESLCFEVIAAAIMKVPRALGEFCESIQSAEFCTTVFNN